jgi:TusA-related sulfurtransferase
MGEICPVPIIRLKGEIDEIEHGGGVLLITDHSCTVTSTADFCKQRGYHIEKDEVMTGVWEICVTREYSSQER